MSVGNRFSISRMVFVTLLASSACLSSRVSAGSPQAQSQMRRMAIRAAAGPIKLDVQPEPATAVLNSNVSIRVFIHNADNQPAAWNRPCIVSLEITFPSKNVVRQEVVIPTGESSGTGTFAASEYGVVQIRVKENSNSLLSAGNTVFVYSQAQGAGWKWRSFQHRIMDVLVQRNV